MLLDEKAQELLAGAEEARRLWVLRDSRWSYFRLFANMAYRRTLDSRFPIVITNEGRNLLDMSVSLLAGKGVRIRFPSAQQDLGQRALMDKAERFSYGVLRDASRLWTARLHGELLNELAWYVCMGGYAAFPRVERRGRDIRFACDLWDPIHVYPIPGPDGLERVYRIYDTSYLEASRMAEREEFDVRLPADQEVVEVINCFYLEGNGDERQVYNCIWIGGKLAKEPTEHREFDGVIPVVVGPAGGLPYRAFRYTSSGFGVNVLNMRGYQDEGGEDWTATWGLPVFFNNIRMQEIQDMVLTYEVQRARRAALADYIDVNEQGEVTVDKMDIGTGVVIPRKPGEDFRPVPKPEGLPERSELLSTVAGAVRRGGLPDVSFGQLSTQLANITVESLKQTAENKLLSYSNAYSTAVRGIVLQFMGQFKQMGVKVSLPTRARSEGPMGQMLLEDFEKKDIPDTTFMEVETILATPDNWLQKLTAASTALPGQIVIDPVTVRERILELDSSDVIDRRIREMEAANHPLVKEASVLGALRRRQAALEQTGDEGDAMEAEVIGKVIDKALAEINSQVALAENRPQQQATREPAPENMAPEAGGAPPGALGMGPGTQPRTGADLVEQRLAKMGLVRG